MLGFYRSVRVRELNDAAAPIIESAVKGYARSLETRQLLEPVEANGGLVMFTRAKPALAP